MGEGLKRAAARATRKPKKAKPCNCLELTQKALAEKYPNVRLRTELSINFTSGKARVVGPVLEVEKIDTAKRERLPTILCTYCPFCGKKVATG